MTTLGSLGGALKNVQSSIQNANYQNTAVTPPGGGQYGTAANNPDLSTSPISSPDTQLQDLLASFSSGGTGSSGRAGSSDPRLNNLALQQNRVGLWDQYVTSQNDFAILANQLQNKQNYVTQNYQTQLGNLLHQYGSNVSATEQGYKTNLFNLNAGAAAAGSYGSQGANMQRSDLAQTEQRTLADLLYGKTSGETQLKNTLAYQTQGITDAEKKAYNDQLSRIFNINQQQQYNDLAMQIAGI